MAFPVMFGATLAGVVGNHILRVDLERGIALESILTHISALIFHIDTLKAYVYCGFIDILLVSAR